jgi:hypothetical protein
METTSAEVTKLNAELAETLTPDARAFPLNKTVSEVILHLMNNRVPHGVQISTAAPAKLASSGSFSRLDNLSEPIKGTTVKSVRINLSGTYSTYQGLLRYLDTLSEFPVAIVRLKVQEQSFELAVRVYGKD